MDRRCTTIGWLGIVCLTVLTVAIETEWIERKGVFYSPNDRIMDRMLRTMDESVSPCQNFHKYSSGRYGQGFDENPDYILPTAVGEKINPKFRDLFEKLKNRSGNRDSMEEKVVRLYNSCEAASKENRTSNIFLDVMRPGVNISWPSYMPKGIEWPKEQFRWLDTLARLGRYGLRNVLFQISLKVDSEDSHSYVYVIERSNVLGEGDRINRNKDKLKAWGVPETLSMNYFEYELFARILKPKTKRLSLQELKTGYGISLIEYFKIVIDPNFDPKTFVEVDVDYLVELNQMLSSYDQETVASYLMERFGTFMTSYQNYGDYQCAVAVRTSMKAASDLLYEEHVLKHTEETESQIQRVSEAIRKQFSQRLEANRMNLSTSYISYLQNKLSTTIINVGDLPKKEDLRSLVHSLYDKLDFDPDDDFATMQLKAMEVQTKSKDHFLDKFDMSRSLGDYMGFAIEFGISRTIFIPHDLLVEPFFMTESHEVFKVSMQGYIIAKLLLLALYPTYTRFDCQHYKEFIGLLDDKQLYWDRVNCRSRLALDSFNRWGQYLVLLNLVHDAYFSPDSGFSQDQPDFTSKPLKELFFLNIAQNTVATKTWWWPVYAAPTVPNVRDGLNIYNPVFKMSTFAEAFNCSTTSYPAANYAYDFF